MADNALHTLPIALSLFLSAYLKNTMVNEMRNDVEIQTLGVSR